MMFSEYILNSDGDTMQPCLTPRSIENHSDVMFKRLYLLGLLVCCCVGWISGIFLAMLRFPRQLCGRTYSPRAYRNFGSSVRLL